MITKTLGILVLGTLAVGGGTSAVANSNVALTIKPTSVVQEQRKVQEPTYTGSITVDEAKYEGVSEQNESKALSGLVTITADQAKQVAEAKVGGTALSVELGSENGTLVYGVKIGKQEVKVDAGNGTVLQLKNDDNEKESAESEGNEKAGDFKKDGIDHQFNGVENHTD